MRVKESPVNDKPTPSPQASARRRLLRGAFSAPAVLTLYSGSAMATSSNLRCIRPTHDTPPVSSDDRTKYAGATWMRVRLRIDYSGGQARYWVAGSDLPDAFRKTGTRPAKGTFHRYHISTNTMETSSSNVHPQSYADKYAVIRVDKDGKIETVGHSHLGTPVSASCWNSIMGTV